MNAEVGDNTNKAEAQQILAENCGAAAQAVCDANGIDEQLKKLASGDADNTNSAPSGAKGNVEAGFYGDVGMAAATGGSATVELIGMGAKIVGESFDKNLGGMEKPVEASATSGKKVSIYTGAHCRDLFSDAANASESINGSSKIKGAKADQAVALLKARDACNVLQKTAELKAGNAINHGAKLGGQALKAQQMGGMAPGGASSPQLALDTRSPKGPTHMRDGDVDEAGAA